jgi:UDP-N-acetylmuramyl pentapeptide phosphotransferase/UDP-N-acetylglucosamine-1-phosphate transferase
MNSQSLILIYSIYCFISVLICLIFFSYYPKIVKNSNLIDKHNLNYGYKPTPTGSGIIFFVIFLIGFFIFHENENFKNTIPNKYFISLISLSILSIISFRDDYKSIDPKLRLIIQIVLIYFSLTSLKLNQLNFPQKVSFFIAVCTWIYLMNITNFIDGSDGFLSSHAIFFFIGVIFFNYFLNLNLFSFYIALFLLPILLIFLLFNKPIASIYMGDAGSIFLGYLIGFSTLEIIIDGHWYAPLALNSYMLLDCSITIFKKTLKGHLPWERLSDYYFLKPIIRNKENQKFVFILINIFNLTNLCLFLIGIITQSNYILFLNAFFAFLTMFIFKHKETLNYYDTKLFLKKFYKKYF